MKGIKSKLSLNAKILASLTAILVLGLGVTAYLISSKSARTTEELSVHAGKQLASGVANGVERDINTALRITETMRDAFVGAYMQGVKDRSTYLSMLESAVKANPQYVGIWTAWEPNALDGRDAEFVNADGSATFAGAKAHDATGRFVPYVFTTPEGFEVTPLTDYDKPGPGDYYLLAQRSGKQQIIEPYPYEVGDKTVIMTSLVTPIIIDGAVKGVVGLDLDLAAIQERLAEVKPYETGSVSLISADGNWAAYSDLQYVMKPIEEQNPGLAVAKPRIAKGEVFELEDHSKSLNTDVLRIFEPVEVGITGTPWSILVNLPKDKVLAPARDLTMFTLSAAAVLVVVLSVILGLLIRALVVRPIGHLTGIVETLASGETAIEVPATERSDELGVMARAINIFRQKLVEMDSMRQRQAEAERNAELEKKRMMQQLADGFEQSVKGIVESVSSAAVELQASAQSMSGVAEESTRQASAVAAAAMQATANVSTVASSAEELSASISEITRQVNDSATSARGAVDEVAKTGATIEELNAAANKIGGIVQMINEIASQTNLLALNATIEAARAGEAGKGFAVVASEVKALATQTSRATEEIATQINEMQGITHQAVDAMGSIRASINRISEISSAIAAAVEEQSAATREISNNANQAATGTGEVNQNITGVSDAAHEVGGASSQVLSAADRLSSESNKLKREVETFISRVRAN
ncbi:methyl-accepting chemotaxis protein [Dongia deserti]|uniref:methyl-accepting chemotaxis protein n=1 Tax=Dongia deserti TaxID=2268030 RepID=UPI0013C45F11|nr:methyl-accepting chemotaxis protein [Dongia deserti]